MANTAAPPSTVNETETETEPSSTQSEHASMNSNEETPPEDHHDTDTTANNDNDDARDKADERFSKKTKLDDNNQTLLAADTSTETTTTETTLPNTKSKSAITPSMAKYIQFHQTYHTVNSTKIKKKKKKFLDPSILETRRTIQLCCRDNDLEGALLAFRGALGEEFVESSSNIDDVKDGNKDAAKDDDAVKDDDGENSNYVYLEPQSLYNLLNLCDGSFGEREKEGRVHVGTPREGAAKKDGGSAAGDVVDDADVDGEDQNVDDNVDGNDNTDGKLHEKEVGADEAMAQEKGENNHANNKDNGKRKGQETTNSNHSSSSSNNNNKISLYQRLHHAKQIHTLLTSLNIPCIEPAYTALIRLSSRVGDWDQAEQYLEEAERTQQCKPKLRMYSSLLRGYCDGLNVVVGDNIDDYGNINWRSRSQARVRSQEGLIRALKIWKRMYDESGGPSTGHPQYSAICDTINSSTITNTTNANDASNNANNTSNSNDNSNTNNDAVLFGEGISPKITLTEYEYSSLMQCATSLHDVPVMERVLSDLAERVLIPGLSTTEDILNWFRCDMPPLSTTTSTSSSSALDHVVLPPREGSSIGVVTNDNGKGWVLFHGCTIDSATGVLTLGSSEYNAANNGGSNDNITKFKDSEYRLKPVELTNEAWDAMRNMNSSIVLEGRVEGNVSQYQGGGKGKKRPRGAGDGGDGGNNNSNGKNSKNNNNNNNQYRQHKNHEWRVNEWNKFESFIQNHPPFNVVIDGANVGYFQQNFGGAPRHVDYRQIDWLIRHLLDQSSTSTEQHHIMLFLHERHFSPKLVPKWAYPIIDMWDSNQAPYNRLTVCRTPAGMNDDWFWMHAALMRGGQENSPSVLAITNDEMRDHHFQMLAQGSFLRWKERHQVHFEFGAYNKKVGRRDVLLQYPNSYSRRIQRLGDGIGGNGGAIVIPLPQKGDEGRYVDGVHVAEEGAPTEETYAVIQMVTA